MSTDGFCFFFPTFISNMYPNLAKLFSGWLPLWLQHKILKNETLSWTQWRVTERLGWWWESNVVPCVTNEKEVEGLGWCNSQPDSQSECWDSHMRWWLRTLGIVLGLLLLQCVDCCVNNLWGALLYDCLSSER